jgi:pimeloyl-ACP methyl ester carboxylesterase
MTDSSVYTVAQTTTRLIPNCSADHLLEVPGDLPGVVIFLHGVNDPGASYESVETGLCQGFNERLDRPDLKAGRYGADFSAAKNASPESWLGTEKEILDDPDTYLYRRDADGSKIRSLLIPFYWGYRAEPGEIKRDINGDPARLRDQFQDLFNNRLDHHFAKGGGFFANATNNLLDMYEAGFADKVRHVAQVALPNSLYMGKSPHRRYFVLAATRLAMLVSEIRRVSPDETITIMGHSQGTLITLLAQAMLVDRGERCADCAIMVASPYSVMPGKTPKDSNTLKVLIDLVQQITQSPHMQPPLSDVRCGVPGYGGRTGPRWSPEQGHRLGADGQTVVFPERDNRGKVYLYFCPDDTTVALKDVHGIGTYGVPDMLPDGRPAMNALQSLGFYQRLWTKRVREGKPVLVGKAPQQDFIRAKGEARYPGGWSAAAVASRAPIQDGQERNINAEQLYPPHEPQMFGGEALTGSTHKAGMDRPDAVSQNAALGNTSATFKWIFVQNLSDRIDVEVVRDRWNHGKEPDDQTHAFRRTAVSGIALLDTKDHYRYEREETPNEIRARMEVDPKEWSDNSYHSAVLRSPENHRWVTAMDIAIGQAKCLDDPVMREVLVAIADWKMDKKIYFEEVEKMKGWSRLTEQSRTLVKAGYLYYQEGRFPSSDLVSLTPPNLISPLSKKGAGQ